MGLLTRPEKRIRLESRSQIRKTKGRVAWKVGLAIALERSIITAVAAAASVPSSFTSTKAVEDRWSKAPKMSAEGA